MLEQGKISGNQLVVMLILFLTGTTWLIITGGEANENLWLVIIMATFWGLFVASIYVSLSKYYPCQSIIEILPKELGLFFGKLFGVYYVFFFIHLTALIFRNMGDFFAIVIVGTPMEVYIIVFALLSAYAVRRNIEVIARVAQFCIIVVLFLATTATIISLKDWDFANLQPVLSEGIKPIIKGWISARGFPFEEIVVFWMVFPFLNSQQELRTKLLKGIFLAGLIIFIFTTANMLVLGGLTKNLTYPSFTVLQFISITGDERLEIFLMAMYFYSALVKGMICYYAGSLGLAQWLGLKDYKVLVFPLGIIITTFAYTVYNNIIEQFVFAREIFVLYIFPLSVLIPLGLLLMIKLKRLCEN